MNGLLDRLEVSIEATMTPHEAAARRAQIQAAERERAQKIEQLRRHAAEAIEALATAIRSPLCSRTDLEQAGEHVARACGLIEELEARL